MKAIAITQAAADGNNIPSLTEIDLPIPTAHGRDLLVAVKAISVNPVDTKVRAGFQGDTPRVLGWDAVGVVQSVGEEVTLFAPGDEVWLVFIVLSFVRILHRDDPVRQVRRSVRCHRRRQR